MIYLLTFPLRRLSREPAFFLNGFLFTPTVTSFSFSKKGPETCSLPSTHDRHSSPSLSSFPGTFLITNEFFPTSPGYHHCRRRGFPKHFSPLPLGSFCAFLLPPFGSFLFPFFAPRMRAFPSPRSLTCFSFLETPRRVGIRCCPLFENPVPLPPARRPFFFPPLTEAPSLFFPKEPTKKVFFFSPLHRICISVFVLPHSVCLFKSCFFSSQSFLFWLSCCFALERFFPLFPPFGKLSLFSCVEARVAKRSAQFPSS